MAVLRLIKKRSVKNFVTLGFVAVGPLLMTLTFNSISFIGEVSQPKLLNILLLVDLVYVLIIAGLVALRITRLIIARRSKSVGSRLHVRLTSVFIFIALMPTVIVAVFATFSINYGLEGWFSDNVQRVVKNSMESAQAYEFEHRRDVRSDAIKLASLLSLQRKMNPTIGEGNIRKFLSQNQPVSLSEAFIVDYSGNLRLRGEKSYLFDFEPISQDDLEFASVGDVVIIEDWINNEFRALVKIDGFANRLLYVSRNVDGHILSLLDETQGNVILYNQIESERGQLLFSFGLIYLAFSVVVLLSAVWFALWFAERLAQPVGELAGAAQKVGSGNFEIQVPEESGEDEIALLGRAFNTMIKRVKIQRDTLLQNNFEIDARKRLFETVIGNVSGGIIGLSPNGVIEVINPAAEKILQLSLGFKSKKYL
jgi:two-component system nitrogen regulation sensor histidine kinase NtrY